jgi:hypothetical protein
MLPALAPQDFTRTPVTLALHIPKGYRLTLVTIEDDIQERSTQTLSGLTEKDVLFCLDLARNFGPEGRLGNDEVSAGALALLVKSTLKGHPEISPPESLIWTQTLKKAADTEDEFGGPIYDLLASRLLGRSVRYGYGFCRQLESFSVDRVAEDIRLVLPVEDCTATFRPVLSSAA